MWGKLRPEIQIISILPHKKFWKYSKFVLSTEKDANNIDILPDQL